MFKKGDFLDLVHTIDDNWLEAKLGDSQGIIPRNYVKVRVFEQNSSWTLVGVAIEINVSTYNSVLEVGDRGYVTTMSVGL